MTDYNLALIEIEKFTKIFKAFDESKNALIALASLDQATKELQKRKDLLEEEYFANKKSFEDWKKASSKEIEKIVSNYPLKVNKLEEEYNQKTIKMEKEFSLLQEKKEEKLKHLDINIQEKTQQNLSLSSVIEDKNKEILYLETKLAQIKNTISSLIK